MQHMSFRATNEKEAGGLYVSDNLGKRNLRKVEGMEGLTWVISLGIQRPMQTTEAELAMV